MPAEIPLAGAIDLDLEITSTRAKTHSDAEVRIANAKGVPVTVEIRQSAQ